MERGKQKMNQTEWLRTELRTAESAFLLAKEELAKDRANKWAGYKSPHKDQANYWAGYYAAITNALHQLEGMGE